MSYNWAFLRGVAYHFASLPNPQTDCTGKVAIVTGATGGLGLEAARHFARLNAAKVVLGCRNTERGEVVKLSIEETARAAGFATTIEVWPLDLGSFESVREFSRRASDELDRLDYVMENAGLAVAKYRALEGYEETITVNVLSTFLMALLLLPAMRRTAARHNIVPHLAIVSSDAHYFTSFPQRLEPSIFEALKGDKDMLNRYYISKLLVILLARELAHNIEESVPLKPRIVVNSVNPGFCNTDLWRNAPWPIASILGFFGWLFGRSTEVGARTLMFAIFAGEESQGKYTSDCIIRDPSQLVCSEEGRAAGRRAYGELLGILEGITPGISENV